MEIQNVKSSNLSQVGYDSETSKLHVAFIGGTVYIYSDVPRNIYEEIIVAPSAGKYFHQNVKNKYAFVKEE